MRCFGCMNECPDGCEICPECGYIHGSVPEEPFVLTPGTVLNDRYPAGRYLCSCDGGWCAAYLGWDSRLEKKTVIWEYLPYNIATRAVGETAVYISPADEREYDSRLRAFVDNIRDLAGLSLTKGLQIPYDCFEENNTAYAIWEHFSGETLSEYIQKNNKIPVEQAISLLLPIMKSLSAVHDAGLLHCNICPDNIYIKENGEAVLIELNNAVRPNPAPNGVQPATLFKPGYAAPEQYRPHGKIGPFTDVYAVGAVLYKMITGKCPDESIERMARFYQNRWDNTDPVSRFTDISPSRNNAIMNALNLSQAYRTPDMDSFIKELLSDKTERRSEGSKAPGLLRRLRSRLKPD